MHSPRLPDPRVRANFHETSPSCPSRSSYVECQVEIVRNCFVTRCSVLRTMHRRAVFRQGLVCQRVPFRRRQCLALGFQPIESRATDPGLKSVARFQPTFQGNDVHLSTPRPPVSGGLRHCRSLPKVNRTTWLHPSDAPSWNCADRAACGLSSRVRHLSPYPKPQRPLLFSTQVRPGLRNSARPAVRKQSQPPGSHRG